MNIPIITRYLEKRNLTRDQLDPEEKETLVRWESILGTEKLTVEGIQKFCEAQVEIIEGKWRTLEFKDREVIAHTIYKAIIKLIQSPSVERESLEKYITELINKS